MLKINISPYLIMINSRIICLFKKILLTKRLVNKFVLNAKTLTTTIKKWNKKKHN